MIKKYLNRIIEELLPLLAVPAALLIGAGMLLALNANPIEAYGALFQGAFGDVSGLTQTLVKATPLLLVGLGVVIAFRGGVINIGAEGQIIVGALATTALAVSAPQWPGWILLPLCLLAGTASGALWGSIPGFLKARLGVNEILSTVMMNAIATQLSNFLLRGPLIDPAEIEAGTRIAQSALLPRQVWLLRLVPRTLLHSGVLIAIVLAVLVYIFLWRTTIGYRIRAVGLNPNASRYAGIPVPIYQALSLILGGAFAGLAGAVEVMGVQHRMLEGLSGGYGFTGIVAALFGNLHPLGAIPASILFGGLLVGADQMQRTVQVPSALISTLLGLIVLLVVGSKVWTQYRARRREINE
ncbi:MAG: ABC transporter permease [Chloroflexi bacterium]|nr:ABC transporter permease [Anaerolineaceae bacterium]NMB89412.1 ABC transporter permease [Chloroflexota bacterium]